MAFLAADAFSLLSRAHAAGRFAHAYLITGPEGSGARELAAQLAGLLLGEPREPLRHPDVHIAEPESRSRRILIDRMRDIEKQLYLRSLRGGRKVAIVFDADRLNDAAANCFLKTLEEPPAGTHIFFVSSVPDQLLDTVLSRCIEVPLRAAARSAPTPAQQRLVELLRTFSKLPQPDMPQVLTLVRDFQLLLAEAKEATAAANEAAEKAEQKLYKQTTDVSRAWLDAREEYYKGRTEAQNRRERALLAQTVEHWWADVLRQQQGGAELDFPAASAETAALAQRHECAAVLRRIAAGTRLRENLERNVQEALAIEVAFLKAFSHTPCS